MALVAAAAHDDESGSDEDDVGTKVFECIRAGTQTLMWAVSGTTAAQTRKYNGQTRSPTLEPKFVRGLLGLKARAVYHRKHKFAPNRPRELGPRTGVEVGLWGVPRPLRHQSMRITSASYCSCSAVRDPDQLGDDNERSKQAAEPLRP